MLSDNFKSSQNNKELEESEQTLLESPGTPLKENNGAIYGTVEGKTSTTILNKREKFSETSSVSVLQVVTHRTR